MKKKFHWFVSYTYGNENGSGSGYVTVTDSNIDMNTVRGIEDMRKFLVKKEMRTSTAHLVIVFFREVKK